jgi:hypothetical protein
LAIDKYGRDTNRRCVTLKLVATRNDVHSLLQLIAPNFAYRELNSYGCTGMGNLDPFVGNAAPPVDKIDKLINIWKYCMRCAFDVLSNNFEIDLPKYQFNEDERTCSKFLSNFYLGSENILSEYHKETCFLFQ